MKFLFNKTNHTIQYSLIIAIAFILSLIYVVSQVTAIETEFKTDAQNLAYTYGTSIDLAINEQFLILNSIEALTMLNFETNHLDKEFNIFATHLLSNHRSIKNVSIAPAGIQQYVYPLEGNEGVIGHDLINDERENVRVDVNRTIETKIPSISGPYNLRQGGYGLIVRKAIFKDQDLWGLIAMVIDVDKVIEDANLSKRLDNFAIQIKKYDDSLVWGSEDVTTTPIAEYQIDLPEKHWTLNIFFTKNTIHDKMRKQSSSILIFIIFNALVLFIIRILKNYQLQLESEITTQTLNLNQRIKEISAMLEASKFISNINTPMDILEHEIDSIIRSGLSSTKFSIKSFIGRDPSNLEKENILYQRHFQVDDLYFGSIIVSDDIEEILSSNDCDLVDHIASILEIEMKRRSSHHELKNLNMTLEEKVDYRTFELESALTDLKNTQSKLVESEKSSALGRMLAGISHEINTPIGVSLTTSSFIQEKAKEFHDTLSNNQITKRNLNTFVDTVLESSKTTVFNLEHSISLIQKYKQITTDQNIKTKRIFDIKSYIQEIMFTLKSEFQKGGYTYSIKGIENIYLFTDPSLFIQIINNLTMNSIIHGFNSVRKGHIDVIVNMRNEFLVIEFIDNGEGIKQEILDKVFDPFYTTRFGQGGSGLGLHIVNNIVSIDLKGKIIVESKEREGTKFIIELPLETLQKGMTS